MANVQDLATLREAAREWISEQAPLVADHHAARQRVAGLWHSLAELGWTGILVPEDNDGSGLDLASFAILVEECGRELACLPLTATSLLAVQALDCAEWGPRIASGDIIVAFADGEPTSRHARPVLAEQVEGGWNLTGIKSYIADAVVATTFLVTAEAQGETSLFVVPAQSVAVTPLDTFDGRAMGHLSLNKVIVPPGAKLSLDEPSIDRLRDLARLSGATEMLGAAWRALELTVEYLGSREQFGVRIGTFQALQHRAARMLIECELAAACIMQGWELAENGCPLPAAAALARHKADEALHLCTRELIQMHGGMGMTAEHPAGRFLKWSEVSRRLNGSGSEMVSRWAAATGI